MELIIFTIICSEPVRIIVSSSSKLRYFTQSNQQLNSTRSIFPLITETSIHCFFPEQWTICITVRELLVSPISYLFTIIWIEQERVFTSDELIHQDTKGEHVWESGIESLWWSFKLNVFVDLFEEVKLFFFPLFHLWNWHCQPSLCSWFKSLSEHLFHLLLKIKLQFLQTSLIIWSFDIVPDFPFHMGSSVEFKLWSHIP